MAIVLRPLGRGDVPALARLYAEVEAGDATGEHYNEADLEEEFANPEIEIGKDLVGAFDGEQLVGHFSVMPRKSDGERKIYGFGATLPARRGEGIGTLLVGAMVARATELGDRVGSTVRLLVPAASTNAGQAELLAASGFRETRWSFTMRRDLDDLQPVPPLPDGYTIRPYADDDDERWLAAHNIAFRDHPDFSPWTQSEWRHWVTGSRNFRPELSFLVTPAGEPGTIASYVQTNEYDAHAEATGRREAYVAKVGTLPDHRGRGLASALLAHCLDAYRAAGYREVSLDVDSLNPTGALGLYERTGFVTERTFITFERALT
jgi:mycothiol synthase